MGSACCVERTKLPNQNQFSSKEQHYQDYQKRSSVAKKTIRPVRTAQVITHDSFQQLKGQPISRYYKKEGNSIEFPFSLVYPARSVSSGIPSLVRVVGKFELGKKLSTTKFFESIAIQKELDHPHIAKVHELYEDDKNYYLIYEYLPGGLLTSQIKLKQNQNEYTAITIMRQVLSAVSFLHKGNIVHRAICPESFLLAVDEKLHTVKLFDLFYAVKMNPEESIEDDPTVKYYCAPEVLNDRQYNIQSDAWSCGVLLHSILGGDMRWVSGDDMQYDVATLETDANLDAISKEMKNLLKALLRPLPADRITVANALKNPLFQRKIHSSVLSEEVIDRFRNLKIKNKLHQLMIMFIIDRIMSQCQKFDLEPMFGVFDANSDGVLTKQEFLWKYAKLRKDPLASNHEMSTLFAYIDVDRSNYITFTGKHSISLEFEDNLIEKEFLMVAIEKSKILTKKNVTSAFKLMDSDDDGCISKDEFIRYLGRTRVTDKDWETILSKADLITNTQLSFELFCKLLGVI